MPLDPHLHPKKRETPRDGQLSSPPGDVGREARVIRLGTSRGAFSRDTLAHWQRWMGKEKGLGEERLTAFTYAVLAHVVLAVVVWQFKTPVRIDSNGPRSAPVNVAFFEGRGDPKEPVQKGEEVAAPKMPDAPPQKRAAPKGLADVRTPPRKEPLPAKVPLTRDFGATTRGPFAVPVPQTETPSELPENKAEGPVDESTATTQVAPSTTSKGLRRLLPGGSRDYLERQRTIGDVMGQGPIGGDVPEAVRTPDPDNRPVIVEREYALSHYFDKLSRRFSDAWGPERTLPPNSTFVGVTGESIDYDIVINRDGSLRKIINVTARRQPWRRFEDVDRIVLDVFSNVFPLDTVPTRIHQDPVVIRKRIQYTGYRYSIF